MHKNKQSFRFWGLIGALVIVAGLAVSVGLPEGDAGCGGDPKNWEESDNLSEGDVSTTEDALTKECTELIAYCDEGWKKNKSDCNAMQSTMANICKGSACSIFLACKGQSGEWKEGANYTYSCNTTSPPCQTKTSAMTNSSANNKKYLACLKSDGFPDSSACKKPEIQSWLESMLNEMGYNFVSLKNEQESKSSHTRRGGSKRDQENERVQDLVRKARKHANTKSGENVVLYTLQKPVDDFPIVMRPSLKAFVNDEVPGEIEPFEMISILEPCGLYKGTKKSIIALRGPVEGKKYLSVHPDKDPEETGFFSDKKVGDYELFDLERFEDQKGTYYRLTTRPMNENQTAQPLGMDKSTMQIIPYPVDYYGAPTEFKIDQVGDPTYCADACQPSAGIFCGYNDPWDEG